MQLQNRLIQNLLIHLETYLTDKTALVRTQNVASTTDIQVAHGNLQTTANVGEVLDGLQTLAGLLIQVFERTHQHVTESLLIVAPHPAPQLMQHIEGKILCIVDNHGVGIGHIQTRLHNGSGNQHIVIASQKLQHDFLQLSAIHLSMPHGNTGIGHQTLHQSCHFVDILNFVMHKEHLSATTNLIRNRIPNQLFVKEMHFGLYRITVGGRCSDDRNIARTHQRELQGSRNRRGRHGQGIHIIFDFTQFLLGTHAKFLFFINNQQT